MTLATKDHVCEDTKGDKEVQRTALVHNRTIPSWVKEQMHLWGERFCFPEWDDDEDANDDCDLENYRFDYGWKVSTYYHKCCSCVISSGVCFVFLLEHLFNRERICVTQKHLQFEYHIMQSNIQIRELGRLSQA